MIRKTFVCLLVAGLMGSAAASAQTADELMEKNLQATGGKEKNEAVKSLRMTGKMVAMQGMEIPMIIELKLPDKLRTDITVQGMTAVTAFDGKKGWKTLPFLGKKDPEPMSEDEIKQVKEQLETMGPLTKYKESGHTMEYVGKEDLEGTPAYKLKLTRKSGDVAHLYLDAESYLVVKMTTKTKVQDQEVETEFWMGDYKAVDGILYPHSMEMQVKGMPAKMAMSYSKVEVNPAIDDSRFAMPAAEKKEAAPPKQ